MEICSLCRAHTADEMGMMIHLSKAHPTEWHEIWDRFEGLDGR
jgi:hypothetical protein